MIPWTEIIHLTWLARTEKLLSNSSIPPGGCSCRLFLMRALATNTPLVTLARPLVTAHYYCCTTSSKALLLWARLSVRVAGVPPTLGAIDYQIFGAERVSRALATPARGLITLIESFGQSCLNSNALPSSHARLNLCKMVRE